jgi:molecular chaperone GrpE
MAAYKVKIKDRDEQDENEMEQSREPQADDDRSAELEAEAPMDEAPNIAEPDVQDAAVSPAIETAPSDAAGLRDRWLRAAAELENLRKRKQKEVLQARKNVRAEILREFLAVLDNLERAIALPSPGENPWLEGVEATRLQMIETLKRFGAEPIEVSGQPFDPRFHEAVGTFRSENQPEGAILEVTQSGYKLEDGSLLRPAKVIVASNDGGASA